MPDNFLNYGGGDFTWTTVISSVVTFVVAIGIGIAWQRWRGTN